MNIRKVLSIFLLVCMSAFAKGNKESIGIYVTPYYDSNKPSVNVGKYSKGLASKNEKIFSETILKMKKNLAQLNSLELYVASVRLYDMGFRDESVYWFYLAQMQSRVFANILDKQKVGKMGSFSFELYHANSSFYQLSGPFINGYAYKDMDKLVKILNSIKTKTTTLNQMKSLYPKAVFISTKEANKAIKGVYVGLDNYIELIKKDGKETQQKREKNGITKEYKSITSKPFKDGFVDF